MVTERRRGKRKRKNGRKIERNRRGIGATGVPRARARLMRAQTATSVRGENGTRRGGRRRRGTETGGEIGAEMPIRRGEGGNGRQSGGRGRVERGEAGLRVASLTGARGTEKRTGRTGRGRGRGREEKRRSLARRRREEIVRGTGIVGAKEGGRRRGRERRRCRPRARGSCWTAGATETMSRTSPCTPRISLSTSAGLVTGRCKVTVRSGYLSTLYWRVCSTCHHFRSHLNFASLDNEAVLRGRIVTIDASVAQLLFWGSCGH